VDFFISTGSWMAWRPWRRRGWSVGTGGAGVGSNPTLAVMPPGSRVRVKAILAGWNASWRLASIGIAPGTVVEVVSNDIAYPWSPIVVRIGGVEVAIGRGIASRIIVEPLNEPLND